jgi:hypothetical protein
MLKYALILLLLVVAPLGAATREYEIKAGFIYNFLRFVDWPTPRTGWTVGIFGSDPFEGALAELEARPLSGKSIRVMVVKSVAEAKNCDVVYIGPSESSRFGQHINSLKGADVLTVSDIPEFADKGGVIGLFTERNRVRFNVNLDALKSANLKANARFLQLASRTISLFPEELLPQVSFERPEDNQLIEQLFGAP